MNLGGGWHSVMLKVLLLSPTEFFEGSIVLEVLVGYTSIGINNRW